MSKCTPKPPETFLRLLECVSQRVYRHFAIENMTENGPDTLCAALRPPSLIRGFNLNSVVYQRGLSRRRRFTQTTEDTILWRNSHGPGIYRLS